MYIYIQGHESVAFSVPLPEGEQPLITPVLEWDVTPSLPKGIVRKRDIESTDKKIKFQELGNWKCVLFQRVNQNTFQKTSFI